ncbi:MAG: terminase large subunit [Kiritimatiellae bacterium]|nr:terminase large subunit [Kiritimatiellia bacterium]
MAKRKPKPPASHWLDTLRLIPGYDPFRDAAGFTFREDLADKVVGFFREVLTHVKGHLAGQPFELQPWEQAIVGNLFGWVDSRGLRRYREAFVYVPRKNGKTALIAGICNYVLFCDGEPGAEIYSAAADRDQASLVFSQAKGMVLQNHDLETRSKIYESHRSIEHAGSAYRVISADANTKHGFNTHFVVVDELHAQPNRELVDVLTTSTGARRQPLVVFITTADFMRESICNEKLDYARKVRDGVVKDARCLPVIYETDINADWTDPAVWAAANPNMGVSFSRENIEAECLKAQETPSFENTFKRLRLNMQTQQDVRWLAIEQWQACQGELPNLDGRPCWGGLDLSSTTDLTALALVFPGDGCFYLLTKFWAPAVGARQRERRDRVPYETWARQGRIDLTDGDVVDYDRVRADINKLTERYDIRGLAIDRWAATQITTQLSQDGLEVVPFGQGMASMSAPAKMFERLVLAGQLVHDGCPVMLWMAGNVAIETDAAGNIKPSKKKSTERIDGIVASVMALGLAAIKADEGNSVYDTRGILTL